MQEQLDSIINTTVLGLGYQVWGYEYRAYAESALLRIFIDHEEGIQIDDCSKVSRQLSAVLDVEDIIPVAYVLEVSSPGADRVLFVPEHYAAYIGQKIKVRTRQVIVDRRNFVGELIQADDENIVIHVDGQDYTIPYDVIDRGRLIFEMQSQPKGKGKGR